MPIELLLIAAAGAGAVVVFIQVVAPSRDPRLGAAIARLTAVAETATATTEGGRLDRITTRAGLWLDPRLQALPRLRPAESDLALLGLDRSVILGRKLRYALLGLLFPTVYLAVVGIPPILGGGAGLVLGALLFLLPDSQIRRRAALERVEWTRTTTTYLELIAIARIGGASTFEAINGPVHLSDHPHLRRIRELISRAILAHQPAWRELQAEGKRLGIQALSDVGDILRLADEDANVYDTLVARAAAMRDAQLAEERKLAKRATQRMALPVVLSGMIFLTGLIYPSLIRMLEL